jgi:hypothetical protein
MVARMRRIGIGWLVAVVTSAGCDRVFSLPFEERTDAAASDGSSDGSSAACPADFAGSYLYVPHPMAWWAAELDCKSRSVPGGKHVHLAVLSDVSERAAVAGLAPAQRLWIGLSDLLTEGQYRWVTDEPTAAMIPSAGTPWWPMGEPDGADNNCVEINDYELDDDSCSEDMANHFVCECDDYPEAANF